MGEMTRTIRHAAKITDLIKPSSSDVPRGHVAVIVGIGERRRFAVPITLLNHTAFWGLLAYAEEEYGFGYQDGPVTFAFSPPGHVAIISGKGLLNDADLDYEFCYSDGPITIPCHESAFFEALRLSASLSCSVSTTRLLKCNTIKASHNASLLSDLVVS